MRRIWTAYERIQVLNRYAEVGALALAEELGRSADSVSSEARRNGLVTPGYRMRQGKRRAARSPTVNTGFFDEPTAAVACVLGYIWACGSIKTKHRHVLRLSCPRDELAGLKHIKSLLGSKHLIQTYENRNVLEICNSRLVESLIRQFGHPPGRKSDGEPPELSDGLVPAFAQGHLLATGRRGKDFLCWKGHRSVIRWLADRIAWLAVVPMPIFRAETQRISIRWDTEAAVRTITAWLESAH